MAKASTRKSSAKPKTAKTSTVTVGKTKVVGATEADEQVIAAAKASVAAEKKTVTADETPDAQPTLETKKAAARHQFAKADRAGSATPEEGTLSRAFRGW